MIRFPDVTDNVTWAREAELARMENPRGISLFLSSLAPASALFQKHLNAEFSEHWRLGSATPGIWGNERLKQVVADRVGMSPEHVMVTSGCTQSFEFLCNEFVRPGDEVILERPGYQVMAAIAKDHNAVIRYTNRGAATDALDLDEIEALCNERTKLVALTNIHNPSGSQLSEAFIEEIAGVTRRRGVTLVIDEVYRDFLPDAFRTRNLGAPLEGVVRIDSLTKTFGVDGICCGWMIAPPDIRSRLRDQYSRALISVSQLAIRGALMVFAHLPEYFAHQDAVMARNAPLFQAFFNEARREELIEGVVPMAGPIAFIRARGETADEIWAWLAKTRDVMLIPGGIYGVPGSTRIGFGGDTAELREGLDRVLDGLREWRKTR